MAAASSEQGPASAGQGRRLTIHLGVQKTGSTSIHRHLMLNQAALADRLVVRTPEAGTPMRPLGRAAVAFSLDPTPATQATLADAIATVRDGLPAGDLPVLISHENLAGAMPGNGGETGLFPALPRIIAALDQGFSDFAVDYVVYTRRMADWRPSVWAQAVKTDGYTGHWSEFQIAVADLPGWGDLIGRLRDVTGAARLTRLRLEDETDPDHPGALLLAHMGLSAADICALAPLNGRAMERLTPAATEFLRRLNGLALNPYARTKVADLVARAQPLFNADYRPEGTV